MKSYDWFWKVKPGAQFPKHIAFDVFRFMRDQKIVFGVTDMTIAELTTEQSSSRLRSLVSQNLDLVHKDADLGWFIKANHDWKAKPEAEEDTETDSTANSSLDFPSHRSALATTLGLSPPAVATGYNEATSTDTTTIPSMLAQAIKSETELKADAFPSWATEHLDIGFEVGSLSFLRSAEHQTIMRRLEELNEVAASTGLGDFVRGLSARTISATILLPMESIWNCRFRPVWMSMMDDGKSHKFMTGNTVVDERSFRNLRAEHYRFMEIK